MTTPIKHAATHPVNIDVNVLTIFGQYNSKSSNIDRMIKDGLDICQAGKSPRITHSSQIRNNITIPNIGIATEEILDIRFFRLLSIILFSFVSSSIRLIPFSPFT
jgi:hypothetical protein